MQDQPQQHFSTRRYRVLKSLVLSGKYALHTPAFIFEGDCNPHTLGTIYQIDRRYDELDGTVYTDEARWLVRELVSKVDSLMVFRLPETGCPFCGGSGILDFAGDEPIQCYCAPPPFKFADMVSDAPYKKVLQARTWNEGSK